MTDDQRKYLVALGAEAVLNPAVAAAVTAKGWRKIMLAISADMGKPAPANLVVDELLEDMGVLWMPEQGG